MPEQALEIKNQLTFCKLESIIMLIRSLVFIFLMVIFTNVVEINLERDKVDSTLFHVVNINVDAENLVSTLA